MRMQNTDKNHSSKPPISTRHPNQKQLARIGKQLRKHFKGDDFAVALNKALHESGGKFLFEIPGVLFNKPKARAAVIQPVGSGTDDCFFIVHDEKRRSTRIVFGNKVDQNILKLTKSYANVLTCLHEGEVPSSVH